MTTNAEPDAGRTGLYRLLTWLSPSFPIGAFSYSHGLEAAVESGEVDDRASLEAWVAAILAHGSGRVDADILRDAYRAASTGDDAALDAANQHGLAYRATAELALESSQQGAAFITTYRAVWTNPTAPELSHVNPSPVMGEGVVAGGEDGDVCHAAAFGTAAARAGIALEDALLGYLQAFAGNLVSAGLRLAIVGQTDGQRILAALEPVICTAAEQALIRDPEDFGSATFAADLASMAHETQYSRLFRS